MTKKTTQAKMPSDKMIDLITYKIVSQQSIEEINALVPQVCEQDKFSILKTYVYHEILESKGFPIKRKVFIYEICQAKIAAAMLKDNPHFSLFMPCKLAIYEENGSSVISTMNMEIMLDALKSDKELYSDAATLFKTLKQIMTTLSNTKN